MFTGLGKDSPVYNITEKVVVSQRGYWRDVKDHSQVDKGPGQTSVELVQGDLNVINVISRAVFVLKSYKQGSHDALIILRITDHGDV